MTRRVVVTGLGAVTPLGHNVEDSWDSIKAGKSGVGPITLFDPANYLVKIAAEVKNWDAAQHMPAKEVRRTDRYQHVVVAAVHEAVGQSGIQFQAENRQRIGTLVGSS